MANGRRRDGAQVGMANGKRADGEEAMVNVCGGNHDHLPENNDGEGFGSCYGGRGSLCQHGPWMGGVAVTSCLAPRESSLRPVPSSSYPPPVSADDPAPYAQPPTSLSALASSPFPLPSADPSLPSRPSCGSSAPPASPYRKHLLRCSRCACPTREPFWLARPSSRQRCRGCPTA